jgi:hypothetical protein
MGYYTYQNKAWAIMEDKIKKMEDKELAEQFQKLMSESASEAFKKSTKTEDVADLLMDAVNSSSFDDEAFAKQVTQKTHRTLQQSFMRAIVKTIHGWSKMHKEDWFDLRNEATVKASSKIVETIKDDYFPLV